MGKEFIEIHGNLSNPWESKEVLEILGNFVIFGNPKEFLEIHETLFQALQYLRKVCNHPKLVMNPESSMAESVQRIFESFNNLNVEDIQHSAKLPALKVGFMDR